MTKQAGTAVSADERICEECGERIFFTGQRWAGVYKLTNGDVCPLADGSGVANDHTPAGGSR